jgi:cation diffusion facilitator CzcD-associated flavoprotein CzcO
MNSSDDILDVAVIGAGFGGIAMAHALSRRGVQSFAILEKSAGPGGTWRDNIYPGCACDIPAHLYSLSFAPNPEWSRMYAVQSEILTYLEQVVDRFGLRSYFRFNSNILDASWNDAQAVWELRMEGGAILRSRSLVSAIGVLHHPVYPDVEGLSEFEGRVLHTALWDPNFDVTEKRVAVIGTGASAIQVIPEIADKVAELKVFQRTPAWIAPRFDRGFNEGLREKFRRSRLQQWWFRAKLFWAHEKRATGFTKSNPEALAKTEALCRSLLDRQVKDPTLRKRLTPDYTVGCKRLIISSDYYPALQKPHVELVSAGVMRIDRTGVIDATGRRHEVDAIVLGTGYDAQNPHSHLPIVGRGGRTLQQAWREDGKNALLGTTVAGFPNFFLVTGPHTGGGHNSQVFMIEAQVHYIMQALRLLKGARAIEVTREAQDMFGADMDRRLERSVWKNGGCMSWFLDPETGRNTLLWPSYSTDFWLKTRRIRRRDYRITK